VSLVSTQVGAEDMLRLAAQGMGVETRGLEKAQLLDRIEQQLAADAGRGKRTLLVVDEAQNLTHAALEELRMLSNFTRQGRALLQIFLLGQPEFRDRLLADDGLEQLRQRVIATHHLEPMDANEVEPYLVHRLAVAGWTGRPGFEPQAFAALYRHSGGVPRRLNRLAERLLLFASIERLDSVGASTVEAVAADLEAERPQPSLQERVLPIRAQGEHVRDLALERRVAALESRMNEQEAVVRRVLTLLVDWVENGQQIPRTNAA
jgi:type II secretory pathway predicted ATPase ExeA